MLKTKHYKRVLASLAWLFLGAVATKAQTGNYLSAEQARNQAMQNNAHIRLSDIEHKIHQNEYEQSAAAFLPQISASYGIAVTNHPLNAFGFLLQQGGVTQASFDPAKLNNPNPKANFSIGADIRMSLFNQETRYARKAAKLKAESYQHKTQYTRNYIGYETDKAYTQLQFSYLSEKILLETLEDMKMICQTVENFKQQGLAQEADVLNAKVQISTIESAIAKARSGIENASEGLKVLMGMEISDNNVFTTDSLAVITPSTELPQLSLLRSDVMAMQLANEASQAMVKSAEKAFLPKINAFGNFQFNNDNVIGFKQDAFMVGINLNWTIYDGKLRKNKLSSNKLQTVKMQEDLDRYITEKQAEVNQTHRNLIAMETEMKKQEASIRHATEVLRIQQNRYKEGLISTNDLLAAQAQLSKERLSHAQTIMQYNITIHYQNFITANK